MSARYAEIIIATVRRIPPGCVATYGQIAELAELPGYARQVGHVLATLPDDTTVPWHRVVNAKGEISPRAYSLGNEDFQRQLLEAEGVTFSPNNRINLSQHRWQPAL